MRLITFAGTNKSDAAEKNTKRPSSLNAGDTLKPSGFSLAAPSLTVSSRKAEDTFQKRETSPEEETFHFILTSDDDKPQALDTDNQEHLAPGRNWNDIETGAVQEEKERLEKHKSTGKLTSPEDDKGDEENIGKMNLSV